MRPLHIRGDPGNGIIAREKIQKWR